MPSISFSTMLRLILQDFLVFFFAYLLYLRLRPKANGLRLPPGPPAEPLLGHIRVIPQENAERAYFRWSKEYGESPRSSLMSSADVSSVSDLIHVRVLGQPIIVLNSVESAIELLERRGAIHSDRPFFAYFDMYVDCSIILCTTDIDIVEQARVARKCARDIVQSSVFPSPPRTLSELFRKGGESEVQPDTDQ